jgi:hypothetical protein
MILVGQAQIEKEMRGDFNKQSQFNINTTDKTNSAGTSASITTTFSLHPQ